MDIHLIVYAGIHSISGKGPLLQNCQSIDTNLLRNVYSIFQIFLRTAVHPLFLLLEMIMTMKQSEFCLLTANGKRIHWSLVADRWIQDRTVPQLFHIQYFTKSITNCCLYSFSQSYERVKHNISERRKRSSGLKGMKLFAKGGNWVSNKAGL